MTEYEEMLYAAGWITAEDVDDEYREHIKSAPEGAYSYQGFLGLKKDLAEAVADYDAWAEEHFNHLEPGQWLSYEKEKVMKAKLSRISEMEYLLGY